MNFCLQVIRGVLDAEGRTVKTRGMNLNPVKIGFRLSRNMKNIIGKISTDTIVSVLRAGFRESSSSLGDALLIHDDCYSGRETKRRQ
jgi:hypothetical protein